MGISFVDLVIATRGQGIEGGASSGGTGSTDSPSSFVQALAAAQSQPFFQAGANSPVAECDVALDVSADVLLALDEGEAEASGAAMSVEEALLAMLVQAQSAMGAAAIPNGGTAAGGESTPAPVAGKQPAANGTAPNASNAPGAGATAIVTAAITDGLAVDGAEVPESAASEAVETGVPATTAGAPSTASRPGPGMVWIDGLAIHVEQRDTGTSRATARVNRAGSEAGKTAATMNLASGAPAANPAESMETGTALLEEAALRSRAMYAVHAPVLEADGADASDENVVTVVELSAPKPAQASPDTTQPVRPVTSATQQTVPNASIGKQELSALADAAPRSHAASSERLAAPSRAVTLDGLADQTVRSIRYLAGREDRTLSVRLIPESLGEMHVEVHSNGDSMTVRLASANASVRHTMEANVQQLRESLARDGIHVSRVEVTTDLASQAGTDHAGGRGDQTSPPPRHYANYATAGQSTPESIQAVPRVPTHQGMVNLFI